MTSIASDKFIINGFELPMPLINLTLGQLLFNKLKMMDKNKVAMIDGISGNEITYEEIFRKSSSLAARLSEKGYGKDSIFSICCENNLQYFVPIIASLYINAIMAPINSQFTAYELTHCLNISKPRLIFTSKQKLSKVIQLKNELNFIEEIIVIDGDENEIKGCKSLNYLTAEFTDFQLKNQYEINIFDQVAFILCSSGTTALPKGIMLTHENILRQLAFSSLSYDSDNISLNGFFYFSGNVAIVRTLTDFINEAKIIVLQKFDNHLFLQAVQNYKANYISTIVPVATFLAKDPVVDKYNLTSIRDIIIGATSIPGHIESLLKKRLKPRYVLQGYGLTESTMLVTVRVGDKFGSCGRVIANTSCKIVDPKTGNSLGPHQVGELYVKSSMVMKGYYNDPQATKQSITSDGWLLTGDLAYYDDEEDFYIVDRLKDVIKYRTALISPSEIESVLMRNPKIRDAAVIGVPNKDYGEVAKAFIVKKNDVDLSEKEVLNTVKGSFTILN